MLKLERHTAVLTSKVSNVGVNLEMSVIGGYLVESFPTLLTATAITSNAMGAHMQSNTLPRFESFPALVATKRSLLCVFEEYM